MYDKLEQQFAAELDRLVGSEAVTVALSGGGDSVALLLLTLKTRREVQAAHLDHALRPDSGADLEFCRQLCQDLGVACHSSRVEVAEQARSQRISVEAAGRRARYEFLRELGRPVLSGHTLEDQAETVVMRLVEGCGLAGLGGIHPVLGDWLFRPLLSFRRQALRDYLSALGQDWLEDPSNHDHRPRARVRAELLPQLHRLNPRVEQALARLAAEARETVAELEDQAQSWRDRFEGQLPIEEFLGLSRLLRSQVLRRVLREHECRFSAHQLEQVEKLCHGPSGKRVELPGGLRAQRGPTHLEFYLEPPPPPKPVAIQLEASDYEVPEWGLLLRLRRVEANHPPQPLRVVLDADRLPQTLTLRARQPGDRLRPHGRQGGAKLKKLMHETGIPRQRRDHIPVLSTPTGPVWVVGYWVSREHLASDTSTNLWEIVAEKPFSQE